MALPIGDKFERRLIIAGMEQSDNTLQCSLHTLNVSSMISGAPGWRGMSTIDSAETQVVVSASAVQSGAAISLCIQQMGSTFREPAVSSGQNQFTLGVDSIVDNISFMVITAGSLASTDAIPFTYSIVR